MNPADRPGVPDPQRHPAAARQRRSRILESIRLRANELLEAEGRLPIAHMTPHTLRRTFASILALWNVPPRRAMYWLGHTDQTLTPAVYQQVLDGGAEEVERIGRLLDASLEEACEVLCGRGGEPPNG